MLQLFLQKKALQLILNNYFCINLIIILDQAASKMKTTETEPAISWTAINQASVLQRFKLPNMAFRNSFTQPSCPKQTQLSCVSIWQRLTGVLLELLEDGHFIKMLLFLLSATLILINQRQNSILYSCGRHLFHF